jgi:hypothetical protein
MKANPALESPRVLKKALATIKKAIPHYKMWNMGLNNILCKVRSKPKILPRVGKKQTTIKMKKILFAGIVALLFSNVSAQFKVRSDGSSWVGSTGYANIWLGSQPYGGYDNGKWAIEVYTGNDAMNNGLNIWKPWPSANAGNYHFCITESGNVGIGKIPSAKLDVAGQIRADGDIYSAGLKVTSDARLKSNINPLSDRSIDIYKLNGKSYTKVAHETNPTKIRRGVGQNPDSNIEKIDQAPKVVNENEFGFLAQELKNVYPNLVQQDSTGYYSIDYIGLIPLIVEAMKAQKVQIEELQQKVVASKDGRRNVDIEHLASLEQNKPNPFIVSTEIGFNLPATTTSASIIIYDMNGTQIKSIVLTQRGKASINLQNNELNPGMYLYTLIADGNEIDTKRMILTK